MVNMDLKKAYDRVGQEFLLAVIEKMGFGDMLTKTLFSNAKATVQVNGYVSNKFALKSSVKQG